jgi:hydrogenase expression/formation protein HypC
VCLAIPAQIIELLDEGEMLARVELAGVRRVINVGLVDRPAAGDWVLVHVGFAIARIDEREAQATIALLEQMGAAYEQELAELREGAAR